MPRSGLTCTLGITAWVFAFAPHAAAHPLVDRGRRLAAEAEFDGAEAAFEQAAQADDLTRADVIALLEGRALVHLALSSAAALEADLLRIAALDPQHRFPPDMPPDLGDAFARVLATSPGPLAIEVDSSETAGAVELRARLVNDPGGLVREVRLHARSASVWTLWSTRVMRVPAAPGERIPYYAEAVGPGGAVVASAGTAEQPLSAARAALLPPPAHLAPTPLHPPPQGPPRRRERGGISPWIWVIGGAVLVAGGAVALGVALSSGGTTDETRPTYPVVVGAQ